MELWIRSQDKMVLTRTVGLRIVIEQEGASIIDEINDYILGTYKTKERTLEVLDEIQKLLTPKMIIKNKGRDYVSLDGTTIYRTNIVSNINSDIQQLSTYVYEMPEV